MLRQSGTNKRKEKPWKFSKYKQLFYESKTTASEILPTKNTKNRNYSNRRPRICQPSIPIIISDHQWTIFNNRKNKKTSIFDIRKPITKLGNPMAWNKWLITNIRVGIIYKITNRDELKIRRQIRVELIVN